MKSYILILSLICFTSETTIAQESNKEAKERKKIEQYENIIVLVESGNYEFIGRKANPLKGRQIDLTTRQNFMKIDGENASAQMPYFGRAFSGGYSSSDGGIKFDGTMENYKIQRNDKKRRLNISFKVKGEGDNYSCSLSISSVESASLSVTSNNKQGISYNGFIKENSEEP